MRALNLLVDLLRGRWGRVVDGLRLGMVDWLGRRVVDGLRGRRTVHWLGLVDRLRRWPVHWLRGNHHRGRGRCHILSSIHFFIYIFLPSQVRMNLSPCHSKGIQCKNSMFPKISCFNYKNQVRMLVINQYHNYKNKLLMLKSSFRLLSLYTKRTPFVPTFKLHPSMTTRNITFFCKTQKHQSNVHSHKHDHHHHRHQHQQKHHENEVHHEEKPETHEKDKHEHQGENQSHSHAKEHHEHEHKYGGGKHGHDHHAAHQTKLSKMTFEELIEIKTEESMKYAHHKYEHEVRRLKELKEEKQHLIKNIKFFQKIEEQIKEKEAKLVENIKDYEEEAELSNKRAQRQIEESKTFAVTKIAKELLEVADCIANCKKYADQTQNKDSYIEEVVRSQQLVKDILKKFDIEEFDPTNQEYDPNLQESLVEVPTPPGYKPNYVAMTMRTGYTIKGRLLRSARVGIFS